MPREARTRIEDIEKEVDDLLSGVSRRKKASIAVSNQLPLRLLALRSAYLSGCVLLDVAILPIGLAEILESAWLYVFLALLVPLVYFEYWLDKRFFAVRNETEDESVQQV